MVVAQYPSSIKAVFFDLMGTCLDWYTGISRALPDRLDPTTKKAIAIDWREAFFEDIHVRFQQNLPYEPFHTTTARLLGPVCEAHGITLTAAEKVRAVNAWHNMPAWQDVPPALAALKSCGEEIFVLANGTMRLQLDLMRSSGLREFDMLFSSEILALNKPDPRFYQKATQLVGVRPEESAMVAAHAYDLRAARTVGMKTVYVRRWTEDTREDMSKILRDVDGFLGPVIVNEGDTAAVLDKLPMMLGLIPADGQ